jgi:hypothetical protein
MEYRLAVHADEIRSRRLIAQQLLDGFRVQFTELPGPPREFTRTHRLLPASAAK